MICYVYVIIVILCLCYANSMLMLCCAMLILCYTRRIGHKLLHDYHILEFLLKNFSSHISPFSSGNLFLARILFNLSNT